MEAILSMTQARQIIAEQQGKDPSAINNGQILKSGQFEVIQEGSSSSPWKLQQKKGTKIILSA
jgi:hypothetical protein